MLMTKKWIFGFPIDPSTPMEDRDLTQPGTRCGSGY
jgi:hypothetical protein